MTDDPGVMGNLPRSRPGRRSDKRASTTKSTGAAAKGSAAKKRAGAKSAAARPKARATTGTRPATGTGARSGGPARAAKRPTAPRTAVREERTEAPKGQDPITTALKLGIAVGDAGVKAVAKIVQRLPRP